MTKNNVRRLSVSDGMEISGFTHDEVHRNLMLLSILPRAQSEVDEDGELVYSFPKDFHQILRKRIWGQSFERRRSFWSLH